MIDPSTLTPEKAAALEAEIAAEFWRRGDLAYKLDETQRKLRAAREKALGLGKHRLESLRPSATASALTIAERIARANVPISFFELCARGNGKTFELLVLAIETALSAKDRRILYVAPLRDDAEKIAKDIIEIFILPDCPKHLRPEWLAGEGEYKFPNGSTIRFRGTNNDSAERLRGFGYHLVILDECGVMDRLKYVVGIIRPLAERMHGIVILATTPGETPDHESTALFLEHFERNAAIKFTLLDNPRLTFDEKARILLNEGEKLEDVEGILAGTKRAKQTNTLRERFVEFVTDAARAVLPEYQENADRIVVRVARKAGKPDEIPAGYTKGTRVVVQPAFFHGYESLDPGIINKSAILWGYFDYHRNVRVVQREKFVRGKDASYDGIADEVERGEIELWGDRREAGGHRQPKKRVIDPDTRLEMDLARYRSLRFQHAQKHDSDGAIKLIKTMLAADPPQIEIDESCVILRSQMQFAIWNKSATDFATEADGGHYDGIAALKYLIRAMEADSRTSPFPAGYAMPRETADLYTPPVPEKPAALMPQTPLGKRLGGFSLGVMGRMFGAKTPGRP